MSAPMDCQLVGAWRITSTDVWDIDPDGPASLILGAEGWGELCLGALTAGLELEYSRKSVFFEWEGDDDGHDVRGQGDASLEEDGTLEITFTYRGGDEIIMTAVRETSSAAC